MFRCDLCTDIGRRKPLHLNWWQKSSNCQLLLCWSQFLKNFFQKFVPTWRSLQVWTRLTGELTSWQEDLMHQHHKTGPSRLHTHTLGPVFLRGPLLSQHIPEGGVKHHFNPVTSVCHLRNPHSLQTNYSSASVTHTNIVI